MKRKTLLTLATTLALLSCMTACSIEDPSSEAIGGDNSNVTQSTTSDSTPDATDTPSDDSAAAPADRYELTATTEDAIRALSEEALCEEFLKTLCNGNSELLEYYTLGSDHSALSTFDATYTIDSTNTDMGFLRADVTLDVISSDSPDFAQGSSQYVLSVYENGMPLVTFIPKDSERMTAESVSENLVDIPADGYEFSKKYIANMLYPDYEISNAQWKDVEDLNASLVHLIRATVPTNDAGAFDIEGLNDYISQRFGYSTIDTYPDGYELIKSTCPADQDNEEILYTDMGMGGNVLAYTAREPEINYDTNEYTYIFDMYSDFAYLEKCGELTFTYTLIDDNEYLTLTDVTYNDINGRETACIGV